MARSFRFSILIAGFCLAAIGAFALLRFEERRHAYTPIVAPQGTGLPLAANYSAFQTAILKELDREIKAGIVYQDGYFDGGEPPPKIGVCTDVVIRSFRAAGVDLQKKVARDVRSVPGAYKIERPDPNIDHRRGKNLIVFFKRNAKSLPVGGAGADWQPGDVVFWDTYGDGRVDHCGMVAGGKDARGNYSIVHHWPGLPVSETDGLYRFKVKGHFRWKDVG